MKNLLKTISLIAAIASFGTGTILPSPKAKDLKKINRSINLAYRELKKHDTSHINNNFNEYISNILVDEHEIGNGIFCSISALLKILIFTWKAGEYPIITPENTLYIKLSGDSWNIERK